MWTQKDWVDPVVDLYFLMLGAENDAESNRYG